MQLYKKAVLTAAACCLGALPLAAQAADHPMFDKVMERYSQNITWEEARDAVLAPKKLFIAKQNGKYGVVDRNGNLVLPLEYKRIEKLKSGELLVKKDGKYGLYNLQGQAILTEDYDKIILLPENVLDVKVASAKLWLLERDGKKGVAAANGSIIVPLLYDKIIPHNNKFYVEEKKRQGVIDGDGRVIWPCNYIKAADSGDGGYIIGSEKAYGYYNATGLKISGEDFEQARPFHEGLAAVCKGGLFGFINTEGAMVIPPQFTKAGNFREGAAYVEKQDERYFIDASGAKLFDAPDGKFIFGFREGSAVFKDDGEFRFIDKQGGEMFAIKAATYFKRPDGLIAITRSRHNFSLGGFLQSAATMVVGIPMIPGVGKGLYDTNIKLGYTDSQGNELIPTKNDYNSNIVDGRVITLIDDKAGILNTDGSFFIPAEYDDMSDLDWDGHNTVAFRQDKEYGFYRVGSGVLKSGYLYVDNFVNGLAPVQLTESRWTYINPEGEFLNDQEYWTLATPFYGSFAIVKNLDGRYCIIDKNGETRALLSETVEAAQPLEPDTAIVQVSGKWGVIDCQGRFMVQPEYDEIKYL